MNHYKTLYISILMACLGGFLVGYDTVIISGVLPLLRADWHLSFSSEEKIVSAFLFSGIFGALLGWPLSEIFGRKKTIHISSLFFIAGGTLWLFADGYESVLRARTVNGFAAGMMSMAVPFYLAEISPKSIRGSSVCSHFFFFVLGMFTAIFINWIFSFSGEEKWMVFGGVPPALVLFIGMFYLPESPYWLMLKKRKGDAEKVLLKIRRDYDVEGEIFCMEEDLAEQGGVRELFRRKYAGLLLTGILMAFFLETSGMGAIFYYTPSVLQSVGYTGKASLMTSNVIMAFTGIIFSSALIFFIDSFGRRKMLLIGTGAIVAALVLLGAIFFRFSYDKRSVFLIILALVVYIAGYALGVGSVTRLIIAEIFPLKIRSFSIGISLVTQWTVQFFVGKYFLTLTRRIGTGETFWLYAFLSTLGFLFIYFFLPETGGKRLGNIDSIGRGTREYDH